MCMRAEAKSKVIKQEETGIVTWWGVALKRKCEDHVESLATVEVVWDTTRINGASTG